MNFIYSFLNFNVAELEEFKDENDADVKLSTNSFLASFGLPKDLEDFIIKCIFNTLSLKDQLGLRTVSKNFKKITCDYNPELSIINKISMMVNEFVPGGAISKKYCSDNELIFVAHFLVRNFTDEEGYNDCSAIWSMNDLTFVEKTKMCWYSRSQNEWNLNVILESGNAEMHRVSFSYFNDTKKLKGVDFHHSRHSWTKKVNQLLRELSIIQNGNNSFKNIVDGNSITSHGGYHHDFYTIDKINVNEFSPRAGRW